MKLTRTKKLSSIILILLILLIASFIFVGCNSSEPTTYNISNIEINVVSENKISINQTSNLFYENKSEDGSTRILNFNSVKNNSTTTPTVILSNNSSFIDANIGEVNVYLHLYVNFYDFFVDFGCSEKLYTKTDNNIVKFYTDRNCKNEFVKTINYDNYSSTGKHIKCKMEYSLTANIVQD